MEKIQHSTIKTNGINMHIASIGTGPPVLLLHGFPELWYSWRHQLLSLSSLGYRVIAPDLRGFGDSDAPPSPASYTTPYIVGDLVGLLDHLDIDQVFLVGHDWGATIAWHFGLFRPDRIKALINLSVQYRPRNPAVKFVEGFRALFGDDYYFCRESKSNNKNEAWERRNLVIRKMEKIEHSTMTPNGIKMDIASIGTGHKVVLFLHVFPAPGIRGTTSSSPSPPLVTVLLL
ncbi:hypothetical protein FEM48_Zijuj09G0020300 [Ziziphus jujuba var. spinosa]|uniref:AB hydrolase-1 domain-containing protein n=1 Tax=Ziziphus jujuba var. spinosa TaxID=714518 RepID=A0A978UQ97_ZIZJJ|nr:hypothetical protein FEM48_Zijuj09G0020300 [Ziziphus jujuba var. spinosa]